MVKFSDFSKPVEDLAGDVKDYVAMREDKLKLQTTKVASTGIARMLAMIVIILLAFIVLMLLAFSCVLLLGEAIHSYAGAAFIITGVLAVLLVVLFFCRKKLFVNSFVKLFIGLFYGEE